MQEDSENEKKDEYEVLTAQEQKKLRAALAERNKSNAGKKNKSKRNKGKKIKKEERTKLPATTKPEKAKGCMQLIPKDQQYKFRELLVKKKHMHEQFAFLNQEQYIATGWLAHLRLIEQSEMYSITIYWTRLQVGVKDKKSKKQIWCTTMQTDAKFSDKIRLANAVVSWYQLFNIYIYIYQHLQYNVECSMGACCWQSSILDSKGFFWGIMHVVKSICSFGFYDTSLHAPVCNDIS